MKRALVLSGGGSRGAYQIGVWKALRKLRIKIDIVTGTSIGALNGALIVQNDYKKALKLWNNLSFVTVFDREIEKGKEYLIYKEYIKEFFENGGMDVSALEKTIQNNINLTKFYNSKIDFGLTTFKLNTLSPTVLTKKDIEPALLADYLVASAACYPAFKKKKIGKDIYIDGGFFNNLPTNVAMDLGADEIIAVDLQAFGVTKRIDKVKSIVYIKPNNKLGNFLIFDSKEAKREINLGYNDTMKKYNKLAGKKYTFYKWSYNLNKHFKYKVFNTAIFNTASLKSKIADNFRKTINQERLELRRSNKNKFYIGSIERLMEIFEFDDQKIYCLNQVNKEIKKRVNSVRHIDIETIEKVIKNREIEKLGYQYLIIYIEHLIKTKNYARSSIMSRAFQTEYGAAVYLSVINKTKVLKNKKNLV
jgi:NTE family protein